MSYSAELIMTIIYNPQTSFFFKGTGQKMGEGTGERVK